jgi:signal transduction histidine kinase
MRNVSSIPPLAVKSSNVIPAKRTAPAVEMRLPTSMRKSFFRFVRHTLQGAYAKIFGFSNLSEGDRVHFRKLVARLGDEGWPQKEVVTELRAVFAKIEGDFVFHSQFDVLMDAEEERMYSSNLNKCIMQLEKLAAILDGKPHILVLEGVDLGRLIWDTIYLAGITSSRFSAPEGQLILDADKLDLFLLFENLISNSMRACKRRGVEPDIEVIAFPSDTYLGMAEISVKDNGIGFTPGELIHAESSRKFTTKEPGQETIHGVGLVHCRFIVHQHGGWLSIDSLKNEGSELTFTLPLSEK